MLLAALAALSLLGPTGAQAQSRLAACPTDQNVYRDNCFGTYRTPGGDVYVGEFRSGTYNGQGTYTWANGQKYVGAYRNGQSNGHGTHTFPSGEKFVGEFKDDQYKEGTFTYVGGHIYVGEFKDNKRDGQGILTYPNGEKFVGEFKGDQLKQGTYTYPSGHIYVGEFKGNKRGGLGTMTKPNGDKYVGEFKDDLYHGLGTYYSADGAVQQSGLWENDKFVRAMAVPNSQVGQPAAGQRQPPPPPIAPAGRRVALIIGNARYKNASVLENPGRDAQLLATTLRNVGFQSVVVKNDLSRDGLARTLREFATLADGAEWAVVYYSGHGMEFGGVNYLIPVDAILESDRDIDLEAVNVGQVISNIEGASRLRLVILDACRNNPFASQMRRTMRARSLGRGLAQIEPDAGTLVVYAAKHGEVALDGAGTNSPFAAALAKRIQQTPPQEVRRLFDLVRDDVLESTGRKQQPYSYGSLSGREDFYFVR